MRYLVVIEKAEGNYSAYVPDLSDCIAVGDTVKKCEESIREAIDFHIRGLREDGIEVQSLLKVHRAGVAFVVIIKNVATGFNPLFGLFE